MPAIKVIEFISESRLSWEDAAKKAIAKASTSIKSIKSVYLKEHSTKIENGDIINYCISAKVSFLLN